MLDGEIVALQVGEILEIVRERLCMSHVRTVHKQREHSHAALQCFGNLSSQRVSSVLQAAVALLVRGIHPSRPNDNEERCAVTKCFIEHLSPR